MPLPGTINFKKWIDENREKLKPPVGNAQIWSDTEFMITVVGGPNCRNDFHIDPGEEFFYQLEGDMTLRVVDENEFRDVTIAEGEMYLLPAFVPHSPQRPEGTLGLVIERRRRPGEKDGLRWYCDNCSSILHEAFLELKDISKDLKPILESFQADEHKRTCRQCGHITPPAGGKNS